MSNQRQNNSLVWVVLVVVAVIVLLPLLTMMFMMPMMGMMRWGGGGTGVGFSPVWNVVMMLVGLVVVVGLGYVLYRGLIRSQDSQYDQALEELRTTYARGELSDEEFERRRERLQRDQE